MLRATRKHTLFGYLNNGLYFLTKKLEYIKFQNLFENYSKIIIEITQP